MNSIDELAEHHPRLEVFLQTAKEAQPENFQVRSGSASFNPRAGGEVLPSLARTLSSPAGRGLKEAELPSLPSQNTRSPTQSETVWPPLKSETDCGHQYLRMQPCSSSPFPHHACSACTGPGHLSSGTGRLATRAGHPARIERLASCARRETSWSHV
jgi:hypothetical protein